MRSGFLVNYDLHLYFLIPNNLFFRMATAVMCLLFLLVRRRFEGVAEICFSTIHAIDNTCYMICVQKSSNVCLVAFFSSFWLCIVILLICLRFYFTYFFCCTFICIYRWLIRFSKKYFYARFYLLITFCKHTNSVKCLVYRFRYWMFYK